MGAEFFTGHTRLAVTNSMILIIATASFPYSAAQGDGGIDFLSWAETCPRPDAERNDLPDVPPRLPSSG
jgi:hypothetical protein